MNLLVLSGSTRRASLNTRLGQLFAAALPDDQVVVRHDLARLPHFDADLEAAGCPSAVRELRDAVAAADLLVIATPEYNGAVPGVLANAIDWLSRPHRASPLQQRDVLVVSASPSPGGGQRAAAHLRQILAITGAQVRAAGLSLARANDVLTDPANPQLLNQLHQLVHPATGVQTTTRRVSGVPVDHAARSRPACASRAG